MRPLIALSARFSALAVAVVLALGLGGGTVRLLPWLVARDVPFSLSLPFARVLLGAAVEVALIIGLPVGAALGASRFVERGEARALGALGARPFALGRALALPGIALVLLYAALAASLDTEPPGRLAARLVSAGRATCVEDPSARRVDVPLVALTWLCLDGGPRLAGHVPGLGDGGWFTASDLRATDELTEATLLDLHWAARRDGRTLSLTTREAHLVGLPRWGKPPSLSGAVRGALLGAAAVVTALAATAAVLAGHLDSLFAAAFASGAASLGMFALLRAADAAPFSAGRYGLVPISGIVLVFLGGAAFGAARRIARRWAG